VGAGLAARTGRWWLLLVQLGGVALVLGVVALPVTLAWDHIRAEWSLAFGAAHVVDAVVVDIVPRPSLSRVCPDQVGIIVLLRQPGPRSFGEFSRCSDAASDVPLGRQVQVTVQPGNPQVVYGEGRGSAWFGVVLESLLATGVVLLLQLFLARAVAIASRRWRTWPSVLRTAVVTEKRRRATLFGGSPASATTIIVPRRFDGVRLLDGDVCEVVGLRRSLVRRRVVAPYLLRRVSDGEVFWTSGGPLLPLTRLTTRAVPEAER
jgi:hypothetical protein